MDLPCTPKRYEFTSIQELFPLFISFSRGTTRVPATEELSFDAHEITAKNILLEIFSQLVGVELFLSSLRAQVSLDVGRFSAIANSKDENKRAYFTSCFFF